jgi:hypothetical protein
MVTIGVVAGVIVAAGTIVSGAAWTVRAIFNLGRDKEREQLLQARLRAELDAVEKGG